MKKEIIVIACVQIEGDGKDDKCYNLPGGKYYVSSHGYWHSSAANQCLAAIAALAKDKEEFLLKVLTTAQSDSLFVRTIKLLQPDILLCGFPVEKSEAVQRAIQGAHGVYVVTDVAYETDSSVAKEVALGRSISDACLRANVEHVVYVSQMHVYGSIGLRSDPCDAKAHVADYLSQKGVQKTVFIVPFLYEDFLYEMLQPRKTDKENVYNIIGASGYIPIDFLAMRDLGRCISSVFKNSKQWQNKTVALSGDKMTLKEYAQTMTNETFPQTIVDGQVTPEEFIDRNDWEGAEDMANFFDYLTRGVQRNNQVTTMLLVKDVQTFFEWTKANKYELIKILS